MALTLNQVKTKSQRPKSRTPKKKAQVNKKKRPPQRPWQMQDPGLVLNRLFPLGFTLGFIVDCVENKGSKPKAK